MHRTYVKLKDSNCKIRLKGEEEKTKLPTPELEIKLGVVWFGG